MERIREGIPDECYDCGMPIARCASAWEKHQCPIQLKEQHQRKHKHE